MDGYLAWEFQEDVHVNNNSRFRPDVLQAVGFRDKPILPANASKDNSISISTIFNPGSTEVSITPDCVVISGDDVLFYLNANVLSMAGPHTFPLTPVREGWLTDPGPVAQVPESSVILNIIFCTIYAIPCDATAPSAVDICHALDRMFLNGIYPGTLVQKGTPLYTLLLTRHVPYHPLLIYSTAAQYSIESLAQDASSHLLGIEMEDIDDASACKMGPLYLKRLSLLNVTRVKSLKTIALKSTPACHTFVKGHRGCSKETQKAMRKEWLHTVIQLTWDVKSSISPHLIKDTCRRAGETIQCLMCRERWNECADGIAIQWAQVKFTI